MSDQKYAMTTRQIRDFLNTLEDDKLDEVAVVFDFDDESTSRLHVERWGESRWLKKGEESEGAYMESEALAALEEGETLESAFTKIGDAADVCWWRPV
jgi:hypothetical protein